MHHPLMRAAPCFAGLLLVLQGCGGESVQRPPPQARAIEPAPVATADEPTSDPLPNVRVKGLTGTLTRGDVHQTMNERHEALFACIENRPRRMLWISGKIRFDFTIDARGKVIEVHPSESNVGHHALESCLTQVVAQTKFPVPYGRAEATFSWDMTVDPASRLPDLLDPRELRKVLKKHARDTFRACKVRRYRNRFTVTAYIGRKGNVLAIGAVPSRPGKVDEEKFACVLNEIQSWRMPKLERRSKVTFVLR